MHARRGEGKIRYWSAKKLFHTPLKSIAKGLGLIECRSLKLVYPFSFHINTFWKERPRHCAMSRLAPTTAGWLRAPHERRMKRTSHEFDVFDTKDKKNGNLHVRLRKASGQVCRLFQSTLSITNAPFRNFLIAYFPHKFIPKQILILPSSWPKNTSHFQIHTSALTDGCIISRHARRLACCGAHRP